MSNTDKLLAAALAAAPPAPDPREALAARPLLEQVARMGDRIGQHTVGEIAAISDRAAAWLAENQPGQLVAIEPRGCPTPGACSCVEPPAPEADAALSLAAIIRSVDGSHSLGAAALADAILSHPDAASVFQPPAPDHIPGATKMVADGDGEREEMAQWLERFYEYAYELGRPDWGHMTTRTAALLRQPAPAPVPVSDRPWEREEWCDAEGRCWWGMPADEFFSPDWTLGTHEDIEDFYSDAMPQFCLPHWAIPQPPQGEEVAE